MRGGDGSVSGSDRNLMEIGYDISSGIQTVGGGALVLVDLEAAGGIMLRSEPRTEFGTNVAAERGIDRIECLAMTAAK